MRPILWYLAFVGLPVVALLGILRLGAELVPPRAVHGRYTVAVDTSGNNPCLAALLGERELTISQSGPRLDMQWGGLSLAGALSGDTILAAAPLRSDSPLRAAGCLTAHTLKITASVDSSTSHSLAGQLLFEGCAACAPAPFRGTRVTDFARSGST